MHLAHCPPREPADLIRPYRYSYFAKLCSRLPKSRRTFAQRQAVKLLRISSSPIKFLGSESQNAWLNMARIILATLPAGRNGTNFMVILPDF